MTASKSANDQRILLWDHKDAEDPLMVKKKNHLVGMLNHSRLPVYFTRACASKGKRAYLYACTNMRTHPRYIRGGHV